jgi:hypothetical protein
MTALLSSCTTSVERPRPAVPDAQTAWLPGAMTTRLPSACIRAIAPIFAGELVFVLQSGMLPGARTTRLPSVCIVIVWPLAEDKPVPLVST